MADDNPKPFPIGADYGTARDWGREHARRAGMHPAARRLFGELCALTSTRETGTCNPGIAYLARKVDCAKSTVPKSATKLEEGGLVERERSAGGRGKTTLYRVRAICAALKLSDGETVSETVRLGDCLEKQSDKESETVRWGDRRDLKGPPDSRDPWEPCPKCGARLPPDADSCPECKARERSHGE